MNTFTFCRLMFLVMLTPGCVSSTLPAPLSQADVRRWADSHTDVTVGVEAFHWHAYSDALRSALQDTHLFASVKLLDECTSPPTLIAKVEEPYNGGVATIPIWTFLTLGMIPTVEHESAGYDFSLRPYGEPSKLAHVQYICPTTTTMGWIALAELLMPDMAWGSCEWSDRFHGRFALAVLDQLSTIRAGP